MGLTKIEYSDITSNPIRRKDSLAFYCTRVSPACDFCYAEVMSKRLAGISKTVPISYEKQEVAPELELVQKVLDGWQKLKTPKRIFVTSMTDMFGEFVKKEWLFAILDAMIENSRHTFQCFTKRAGLMQVRVNEYCNLRGIEKLPENIWLIVSVENQQWANSRIPKLIKTRCTVRGLSCEPLLEQIDITPWLCALNWILCGGESGTRTKRPMHTAWALSLRDQCAKYGVSFFFKQWGSYIPMNQSKESEYKPLLIDGEYFYKVGKKVSGHILDGKEYLAFPTVVMP